MGYTIMNQNQPVVKIDENGYVVWKDEAHCPLYFLNRSDFAGWLETRASDSYRANIRHLRRVLGISERSVVTSTMAVNAACVTDTFWVKPDDSTLCWEDVRFSDEVCAELALTGKESGLHLEDDLLHTPELTNIGRVEKCWKREGDTWWLHKQADNNELFSEVFVYQLGMHMGMSMAEYQPCGNPAHGRPRCIKSRNFAAWDNFEPIHSLMGENVDDYIAVYRRLEPFGEAIVWDYVDMMYMDALCMNSDRHCFNFGLLRNPDSGKVLQLAPNYDNNMALFSFTGKLEDIMEDDLLIEDFVRLFRGVQSRKGCDVGWQLHFVTPELLQYVSRETSRITGVEVDHDELVRRILARYQSITKRLQE